MAKIEDQVLENIARFGLSVLSIGPDSDNDIPPFSYSIGLSLKEGSELLCESLPPDISHSLISEIASQLPKNNIAVDHSCIVRGLLQHNMPIALVVVDEEDIHDTRTIQVSGIIDVYNYKVLQVILPDSSGIFPWQEGHDIGMGIQNIHRKDSSKNTMRGLMDNAPTHVIQRGNSKNTKH